MECTWNTETDKLTFQPNSFETQDRESLTKRQILRESSKIFDPLGLLSPLTVKAKIFMQSMWKQKLDWDEPLPDEFQAKWTSISRDLSLALETRFERYLHVGKQQSTLHV